MTHRFAVFGDVHGRVALMLTLARRFQQQTSLPLDGILQVGDMGAFPDHQRLDSSTRRFARRDPDELGFLPFLSRSDDGEQLLAPRDSPPVVFCRGNHEDFEYLEMFHAPTALDPWGKLWFVPDGHTLDWSQIRPSEGRPPLRLAAFGGAAPLDVAQGRGRTARGERRKALRREQSLGMQPRFHRCDLEAAARQDPGPIDLLLTHAGPAHPSWRGGSKDIVHLARSWAPRVHLFGHHHQIVGPLSTPHGLIIGFEHLDFLDTGQLRPGSWGVLEIDESSVRFQWMLPQTHRWLYEMTRTCWR